MPAVTAVFLAHAGSPWAGRNVPDWLAAFFLILFAVFVLAFVGAAFADAKKEEYDGAGCLSVIVAIVVGLTVGTSGETWHGFLAGFVTFVISMGIFILVGAILKKLSR